MATRPFIPLRTTGSGTVPCRLTLLTAALSLLLLAAGCGRPERQAIRPDLAARCVVAVAPRAAGPWPAWLDQHLPDAARVPLADLAAAAARCREADLVLLIETRLADQPDVAAVVEEHLDAGGRLAWLGTQSAPASARAPNPDPEPWYAVTTGLFRAHGAHPVVDLKPRPALGILPGFTGAGGEAADALRWIPTLEAITAGGQPVAWPGAITLLPRGARTAVCGWLGINPLNETETDFLPLAETFLAGMTRTIYLHRFGLPRFSVTADRPLQVTMRALDRRREDFAPVRLIVEWRDANDREVRRHVSPPLGDLALLNQLNIGLAPAVEGPPQTFTLRFLIRDRNDQRTYDLAEQTVKVFSANPPAPENPPVTVNAGNLVQGRRPVFMVGLQYWPRLSGLPPGGPHHWLDPGRYQPAVIGADLDAMTSVGVNAIALEYTHPDQAPQLLHLLDELRRRSMWAFLHVPALHPLDLRLEAAEAMLRAIDLRQWPEVFALELARGLVVRPEPERRRLDPEWARWVDEHFSSVAEAEQKLGISLWRERGRLVGPPDRQIERGPHRDRAVALYYVFLRDLACRRIGYLQRWLDRLDVPTLVTVRSAYDLPVPGMLTDVIDALDISAGSLHQDFLSPDAWTLHPLRSADVNPAILPAYVRGIGGGKPVVWAAYGQHVGTTPDAAAYQRQREVYQHYLDLFIREEASGAFAWWFLPGTFPPFEQDWGVVHPGGGWRPVEHALRETRLRLRQLRNQPRATQRRNAPLVQSARQLRDEQAEQTGLFAPALHTNTVTEWVPPGTGLTSVDLLRPDLERTWSDIEGFHLLNAEWGALRVDDTELERMPGENARIYVGKTLALELINSGTVRWIGNPERKGGAVFIRISQPGHRDEWLPVRGIDRGGRLALSWRPRETGIWDLQPHLVGYGKFGERLQVEVTTPPRMF